MKFVAILCLALIAGVAANTVAEQDSTAVVESNDAEMLEAMPQVDADMDVEEADEEALDESEDEVEDEEEAEIEAEEEADEEADVEADEESEEEAEEESEDEVFLEAAAEADAETETETDAEGKPKKKVKIVPKNAPKAPVAIKAAPKAFKFHPERIEAASTNKFEDPEMAKLNLALEAVKEDILSTNKQITDERKWVIAVAKIIASYNDKMKRVEAHIIALRKEMKALYRKKKQIENLKLQKALESKLKEARDELATLTHSLKHVAVKQGELNRSGADLRQTIAGIQAQLAKLRGQQLRSPRPAPRRRCKKGQRYSKKAKKCVARKARKAARKAIKKL
jgi:predicted  nucleic acid-binding Zn-ribbon protein